MKTTMLVLVAVLLCSCGGTEVLNPVDTLTLKSETGTFSIGVPEGWDYKLCTADPTPCNDAYLDPTGTSEPLIIIYKGETKTILFANRLENGETLEGFVSARSATQDEIEYNTEDGIEMAIVNVTEDEQGREYAMVFGADAEMVAWLWVQIDFEGLTDEECQALSDEWAAVMRSMTIGE